MAATLGEGREPTLAADAQLGCLYARRREQLRALILHKYGENTKTQRNNVATRHTLYSYITRSFPVTTASSIYVRLFPALNAPASEHSIAHRARVSLYVCQHDDRLFARRPRPFLSCIRRAYRPRRCAALSFHSMTLLARYGRATNASFMAVGLSIAPTASSRCD